MTNNLKIGFMQGRLVNQIGNQIQCFPNNSWKKEFELSEKIGFHLIEWIFDDYSNPILFTDERNEIKLLSEKYNVLINSVCADFFMVHKLFSESENELTKNLDILKKLIEISSSLGIKIIEIPLVDSSSLSSTDNKIEFKKNLEKIIPLAETHKIILNLETDLPPLEFKELINSFQSNYVRANYDVGNSTSLGYNVEEELDILKNLITNVHIKDRLIGGRTVPLGKGDVNFVQFFQSLSKINYSGDLIIQGARKDENSFSPYETCSEYKIFIQNYLDTYFK